MFKMLFNSYPKETFLGVIVINIFPSFFLQVLTVPVPFSKLLCQEKLFHKCSDMPLILLPMLESVGTPVVQDPPSLRCPPLRAAPPPRLSAGGLLGGHDPLQELTPLPWPLRADPSPPLGGLFGGPMAPMGGQGLLLVLLLQKRLAEPISEVRRRQEESKGM